MSDLLLASWRRAWPGGSAAAAGDVIRDEILARYSERHRAYHTLQHLTECLQQFETASHLAEVPHEVELALWFHDAIYDVRASDNELQSAEWAKSALLGVGASADSASRVHALIMATRHTSAPAGNDAELLVDIDLSILGADSKRFAEYETQIRQEYRHVPGFLFRYKRKRILQSFLDRPRIYCTAHFRECFEAAARVNLGRATGATRRVSGVSGPMEN